MNKYKIVGLVLLLQMVFVAQGQDEDDVPKIYKYWVELSDKEVSKYSTDKPIVYLTQRAIDRRKKQNIAVTEQDFPVNETYITNINSDFNAQVLSRSRWFNALIVETYEEDVIKGINELSFVKKSTLLGKWDDEDDDMDDEPVERPPEPTVPGERVDSTSSSSSSEADQPPRPLIPPG